MSVAALEAIARCIIARCEASMATPAGARTKMWFQCPSRRLTWMPYRGIAFSSVTTARWTILSSSAATASGRCRPSGLGM